jgi:hypothetical protein
MKSLFLCMVLFVLIGCDIKVPVAPIKIPVPVFEQISTLHQWEKYN